MDEAGFYPDAVAPFGVPIRGSLFPGESNYFRGNPHVTGMAAEDNSVILNPYSNMSGANKKSVIANEAARVHMRRQKLAPTFAITKEQRRSFRGTPYEGDDDSMRATIAARLFAGDPSAGEPTIEQIEFVQRSLTPAAELLGLDESPANPLLRGR